MWVLTWKSLQPRQLPHLALREPQLPPVDRLPLAFGRHVAVDEIEQPFRVCGGSSSSERPSTSCASSLASAMSASVTSMYSIRLAVVRASSSSRAGADEAERSCG